MNSLNVEVRRTYVYRWTYFSRAFVDDWWVLLSLTFIKINFTSILCCVNYACTNNTDILKIKSNNGSSQSVITSIAAIAYGGAIRRHGGRLSCLSIVLVPKHFYNSWPATITCTNCVNHPSNNELHSQNRRHGWLFYGNSLIFFFLNNSMIKFESRTLKLKMLIRMYTNEFPSKNIKSISVCI